jgi:Winged helix DNA-binding domain
VLAERLTAQLLAGPPARSPEAVCERLLAVQGQDPRGFRLAIRARTRGLTAADVDRALNDRSLVVTWLNRGTLHLVRSEDYAWLHAVTAPRHETAIRRRLAQEGVEDPERGVRAIERALAGEGPLPRERLRERVGEDGQALVHLLALASLRGLIVRGPVAGGRHAYVLVRDWLGEQPRVARDAALTELARRYLAGHGPADERDLAKWAGIALRDVRAGLKGVRFRARKPAPVPPPRLLGAFEPVLLGWASRDDVVGQHRGRVTIEGIFRSFAMVGGRAVATWRLAGGEVSIEPLEQIAPADLAALEHDTLDVRRFLGV